MFSQIMSEGLFKKKKIYVLYFKRLSGGFSPLTISFFLFFQTFRRAFFFIFDNSGFLFFIPKILKFLVKLLFLSKFKEKNSFPSYF